MTLPFGKAGYVVQTWKHGLRILWTYVPEMPSEDARNARPWLTVIRWDYDGSRNEGMPDCEENRHMLMLAANLEKLELAGYCCEAYRRIGAGVREFVYYVAERDAFLREFNQCAAEDPRYPISITFYKDEAWSDLQELIDDFKSVVQKPPSGPASTPAP